MSQSANQMTVTPQKISDDLWSAWRAQVFAAGINLSVFTHVAKGKRTVKEIARAAEASEKGMKRLLDALVGMGYLNKKGDTYGLEPGAEVFLVRGEETYMGHMAYSMTMLWDSLAKLTGVVQTGRPVAKVDEDASGRDFFPKLVASIFPGGFAAGRAAAASLPEKARKNIRNILDVAAGSGAWSLAFATTIPDAKVTALDFPEVTPITRQFVERFGLSDRYTYIEGNLREVNFGRNRYDLVILGHIIHSEGEKWGRKLIKKSYGALKDGGMLLIAEMVPNDTRTGPWMPLIFGLNMLLHTEQGDVFTMREYREWLKEAGFKKVRTIEAPAPSPLILATK